MFPTPQASFTFNDICDGLVIDLASNSISTINDPSGLGSNITSWLWTNNTIGNTIGVDPIISYSNYPGVGIWNISLDITDANGCTSTTDNDVEVYFQPIADFTSDSVCDGEDVIFDNISTLNQGANVFWLWDFGIL